MRYPLELNNQPSVTFIGKQKESGIGEVSLYMPQGISFQDGAGYSDFNLGIIGSVLDGKAASAENARDIMGSFREKVNAASNQNTMDSLALAQMARNAGVGGSVSERAIDIYGVTNKQVLNPNTVLQYNGAEIRSYSFSFTLVAKSSKESSEIYNITKFFREFMYPERLTDSNFTLQYPAVFTITFNGVSNMPKIYDCYLTNMNVTYNPNSTIFFEDNSPSEVTMNISFRETKALTRREIKGLH